MLFLRTQGKVFYCCFMLFINHAGFTESNSASITLGSHQNNMKVNSFPNYASHNKDFINIFVSLSQKLNGIIK